MIKVVFDTNIFISGLNFPSSKPARILELAVFGVLKNITSDYILREIDYVLSKKFSWDKDQIKAALSWIKIFSKKIKSKKTIRVIQHTADNRIIECAVSGKAKFIISGDKHLLELKIYKGIKIVTPSEFLELLS